MDKKIITDHLYNDSIPEAIKYVNSIKDEETLAVYAYNYNWDNGFEVPDAILNNIACTKSIALMIYYAADGLLYLEEKEAAVGTEAWLVFIQKLYSRIIDNEFRDGQASFDPQLSKVQGYKLKKALSEKESVFIIPIEGINCRVNL